MEFVFLIGLAFTTMIIFIASTQSEYTSLISEEEMTLVKDLCAMVQRELVLASSVQDGYSRTFNVPDDLEGMNYNIELMNNTVHVYTDELEYLLNIPIVNGTIQKGDNRIRKTDGVVFLNE